MIMQSDHGTRLRTWLAAHPDGAWAAAVAAIGCLIYLPWLGSYPLWDPWEPHYSQVAWEMQERLTWFNPWYRGIDNWWSKPILMLWMLRASLGLFWDPIADFANNELAARIPFAVVAIAGGVLHYDWVRRLFGRKTGILAGIILITAPQYLLLGRQVMADVPFIVAHTAAIGYLAVGLFVPSPVGFPAEPNHFGLSAAAPLAATSSRRRTLLLLAVWAGLAISLIACGWAAPVTAGLVLLVVWAATCRWRDYSTSFRPVWRRYAIMRGGIALGVIAAAVAAGWLFTSPAPGASTARALVLVLAVLGVLGGVFFDFPLSRHAWRVLFHSRAHLGVPLALGLVLAVSGIATAVNGAWTPALALTENLGGGTLVALVFNRIIWLALPFVPLAFDVEGRARFLGWLHRRWPFLAFWSAAALAVLSKGFVTPTLVVLILAGYWLATFRWRDYPELTRERRWLRYALVRGGVGLAVAAVAFTLAWFLPVSLREQRELYQALIGAAAALVIGLAVLHDLPPIRHAWHLIGRVHAGWGLVVFFAIAAPWFVYMSVEHGWPYWSEWIFYHHLGRAAGTIDKPGGSFDYVVRQVAFGSFPWTGFTFGAVWMFLGRSSAGRSVADRRNLFVLLAALLPYLFFSLSGTKFAHYVMPVLPLLAVMLAAALVWLSRDGAEPVPLGEDGPTLGPPVPAYAEEMARWHERPGARGDFFVFVAVALATFGILAHDLVLDYRHLLRLMLYYYNRETPFDYQPFVILQVFFFPMGILIGLLLVRRWIGRAHLAAFATLAVMFACYLGWVTMPAMKWTFSYKPFHAAYHSIAKPGEPIGQYNDWQQPERSVIFLFQNRCMHLRNDSQAAAFIKRPGRKFVIVDSNRLADLRRVAKEAGVPLHVVFDGHPYARLLSDQPNATDTRKVAEHILSELPPDAQRIDADFEGKIRLLGWKTTPARVAPGSSVAVEMYYRAEQTMREDWQIFIHGDGPRGGANRIHVDHFPLEGLYPTTEWQEGEIIRDSFTINIPSDYPFEHLYLWNGWYKGEQRLKLMNNPPNDGQGRVRGPRIDVAVN